MCGCCATVNRVFRYRTLKVNRVAAALTFQTCHYRVYRVCGKDLTIPSEEYPPSGSTKRSLIQSIQVLPLSQKFTTPREFAIFWSLKVSAEKCQRVHSKCGRSKWKVQFPGSIWHVAMELPQDARTHRYTGTHQWPPWLPLLPRPVKHCNLPPRHLTAHWRADHPPQRPPSLHRFVWEIVGTVWMEYKLVSSENQ